MLANLKFFGGLTVINLKSGDYYEIIGFETYLKVRKFFGLKVEYIPVYAVMTASGTIINIDERTLSKEYQVI